MGIPSEAEHSTKYLIKGNFEESWLPEDVDRETFDEELTFLKSEKEDELIWVKKRVSSIGTISFNYYERTVAEKLEERLELIRKLNVKSYEAFLNQADPNRNVLKRKTLTFIWENRGYIVEHYDIGGKKLGILRCSTDTKQEVPIPEFIKTEKNISDDKGYFFHNLTTKES